MEFNEYLAGECVALTMVFITYLCFGLAPVLYVWSYCVIYYTADSDLSIGPVVLAWLVIPVEDIASVIGKSLVKVMRHEFISDSQPSLF